MKKSALLATVLLGLSIPAISQRDTIYSNREKFACVIREVTADAVRFSYPEEELINAVYKNSIQKIVFKSGRVQIFSEATSYKKINSVDDYEKVTISQVEGEVRGLYKLGEVSAKAKGATTVSNQERVKERAYQKLKIGAAMMGGNVIYLTQVRTEGNRPATAYQSGSSTETSLSGVVYTNQLVDIDGFQKAMGDKIVFMSTQRTKLWSNATDMKRKEHRHQFTLKSIQNDNGIITLTGKLQGSDYTSFRLVNFNQEAFTIYYEDRSTAYNINIMFK